VSHAPEQRQSQKRNHGINNQTTRTIQKHPTSRQSLAPFRAKSREPTSVSPLSRALSRARSLQTNSFKPAIDATRSLNQTPSRVFRFSPAESRVFHRAHPIYISVSLVAKRTHDEPLHVFPLMLAFVTTTLRRRYDDVTTTTGGYETNQRVTLASSNRRVVARRRRRAGTSDDTESNSQSVSRCARVCATSAELSRAPAGGKPPDGRSDGCARALNAAWRCGTVQL